MTNQTTNTPAAQIGHNNGPDDAMKKLRDAMRKLGTAEAAGTASRPDAGVRLLHAAYEGDIDERDAEELYGVYAAGAATASGKHPMAGLHASAAQQVSKFRQFIKCGALNKIDARVVMADAQRIYASHKLADAKVNSPFDALVNVCREQIKQPEERLTEDQINGCLLKPESASKSDIDKLVAAYKAASKLATAIPMPSTEAAADAYRDAIVEAGGEVPALTKEEKAAVAAMDFLAKRGMVAAFAARLAAE